MKKNLNIIKLGGAVIDDQRQLESCLKGITSLHDPCVLVHGGGKQADLWLEKMGIKPIKVDGRRITDDQTIEIVTMVFAGLLNKKIVAIINSSSKLALGISGADLNLIQAHKRPVTTIDYGWVGDIDRVNADALVHLLEQNWIPVICSLTHDGSGNLLNTNADTIATQIAIALSAQYKVTLQLIADVAGVMTNLSDPNSLIESLSFEKFQNLKKMQIITGGMIPKLDNAFGGIQQGISQIWISKSIRNSKNPDQKGTLIYNENNH